MFSKLKQYKDLRDQAKTIQNTLAEEKITITKRGITATVNGNMEIVSLDINESIARENIADNIKICINEAMKEVQKAAAQKMRSMGDLSSMLKF